MKTSTLIAIIVVIIVVLGVAVYLATRIGGTSNGTSQLSSSSISSSLPSGAYALPYNPSNKTVFIYLVVSSSSSNLFNFNGTSDGSLKIYVPAGWNVMVILKNTESLPHNANIVQNNTPIPNSINISSDGKIILYVGDGPSNYYNSGVSSGNEASGMLENIPAGYYWIACGIQGHAKNGMWVDLIVSSTISTPYAVITNSITLPSSSTTTSTSSSSSPPGYMWG
ncbi:quinol oxidase-2, sulfocyanin (blue copper protein), (soxE) [Sulfolobus acidocaldarius SUSAZ]|nr:quinol oxidase-2, sulfocyanin (blue copper protein), (soxE) [Sulfolobus acidocaldarius SUSAZ]